MKEQKYNYSFIIPHKNCPGLLQRCVDSIPERDDVQIIVVDDNSDADKKPSVDRKGVEVVLLDAEHSKGAGRARNVGLKYAEGKWLLFADADDYYKQGFLDILDEYRDKDIEVLYFNFEYRHGKTNKILPALHFNKHFENYDGSREAKDQVKFHHNVPWTKMIRHEYLKRNDILFEETINGNDILFSMMVGYFTDNILVEKRPIYVYLFNENSILTTRENTQMAMCRFVHLVKLNYIYKLIGYPEWRSSITRRIIDKSLKIGLPFVIQIMKESVSLYRGRKEWVELVKSRKNKFVTNI